jgi:hypothetical protein
MNMLICWWMYQSNHTEEFCHEVLINLMTIDPQHMFPRSFIACLLAGDATEIACTAVSSYIACSL